MSASIDFVLNGTNFELVLYQSPNVFLIDLNHIRISTNIMLDSPTICIEFWILSGVLYVSESEKAIKTFQAINTVKSEYREETLHVNSYINKNCGFVQLAFVEHMKLNICKNNPDLIPVIEVK